MGNQPTPGTLVRVFGEMETDTHLCTVVDLLSEQFTCVYEWQRHDGGWVQRTEFRFYRDKGLTWEEQN